MHRRVSVLVVCVLATLSWEASAQHLPEGVWVLSGGYARIDSGNDGYSNSGKEQPKLIQTGFGPLYFGALLAGTGGITPPGVTTNFSNVDLRTRGEVYSLAAHYGSSEDLTLGVIARFANVTTSINGRDTTDFAVVKGLVQTSGSVVDEATLNDELLTLDVEGKYWYEDEFLDDDTRRKAAFVFGATYRGAVNIRENLVKFALVELARMNRPPYLRAGYEGQMQWGAGDDRDVIELNYGVQAQYHFSGRTNTANSAAILANLSTGGASAFPVIDDVRSDAHLGAEAFINVSNNVWRGLSFGTGLSWHYEASTDYSKISATGTPTDAFLVTGRDAEERGYLHVTAEYDAIQEYQRGEWSMPWTLALEIRDSIYGRNLSELSIVALRLSVPVTRPKGSAG
ncbi:MAG: hypothetical protein DHS20C15_21580 [Planctomycetota bacterium]|nr:MAG: hypothetical protein DHS20C15_21580 [Planctomycetota bacterium]